MPSGLNVTDPGPRLRFINWPTPGRPRSVRPLWSWYLISAKNFSKLVSMAVNGGGLLLDAR